MDRWLTVPKADDASMGVNNRWFLGDTTETLYFLESMSHNTRKLPHPVPRITTFGRLSAEKIEYMSDPAAPLAAALQNVVRRKATSGTTHFRRSANEPRENNAIDAIYARSAEG
mmetsp:Transcript_56282/g.163174  ORF Transcript_56282/g.163174 Transcript_56282/m.163174 type:complete len:114 (-) Transcript_56282:55-396(-)